MKHDRFVYLFLCLSLSSSCWSEVGGAQLEKYYHSEYLMLWGWNAAGLKFSEAQRPAVCRLRAWLAPPTSTSSSSEKQLTPPFLPPQVSTPHQGIILLLCWCVTVRGVSDSLSILTVAHKLDVICNKILFMSEIFKIAYIIELFILFSNIFIPRFKL